MVEASYGGNWPKPDEALNHKQAYARGYKHFVHIIPLLSSLLPQCVDWALDLGCVDSRIGVSLSIMR